MAGGAPAATHGWFTFAELCRQLLDEYRACTLNTRPALARILQPGSPDDVWLRSSLIEKYETTDRYRPPTETLEQWAEAGLGIALDM